VAANRGPGCPAATRVITASPNADGTARGPATGRPRSSITRPRITRPHSAGPNSARPHLVGPHIARAHISRARISRARISRAHISRACGDRPRSTGSPATCHAHTTCAGKPAGRGDRA